MEKLKEELAKKRKLLEDKALVNDNRKFFKREELIRKSEEEYWRKQEEKRKNKLKADSGEQDSNELDEEDLVGKTPEEIAKLKLKKIIANQSSSSDGNETNERVLPRSEVIRRLRSREQPIIMFGETELDAFRRLRKLEIQEPETSKGYTNDFQEAMEKVDAAYLEELVKSGGSGTSHDKDKKRGAHDVKIEEMNTDIEEILQQAQFLGRSRSRKTGGEDEQRKSDCDVIVKFLKFILELWGKRLNERDEVVKRSTAGKIATATYTQTQSYLRHLFKQLIKGTIADDILRHLTLIIKCMLERNYVKASDAYLQMAIGNAPWPIGVTMVGIHARTGREKIFAQNIAHVLNDETQRKYIQGLKRLMTQCQKMFPTDPSKCVEYTKED